MTSIVTTTQVQQQIGEISANIGKKSYIVTNYGVGKIVMLPYFDGCTELMEEYMEDYEMAINQEKLKKELQESYDSGPSDLVI